MPTAPPGVRAFLSINKDASPGKPVTLQGGAPNAQGHFILPARRCLSSSSSERLRAKVGGSKGSQTLSARCGMGRANEGWEAKWRIETCAIS